MPPSTGGSGNSTSTALLAGASAGILSDGITYPISTAKARLQTNTATVIDPITKNIVNNPSTTATIRHIIRVEGTARLYAGFTTVLMAAPARALYFAGYELALLEGGKLAGNSHNPAVHFIAGPIAQLSGSLLWVPMDVVKERMQIQRVNPVINTAINNTTSTATATAINTHSNNTNYTSSSDAAIKIIRTEGVRGLYRGYIAHQLVWGPFNAVYFMCYDSCKTRFLSIFYPNNSNTKSNVPFYVFPLCGSISGALAAAATAPLDLIKTRLQTQGNSGAYTGVLDCIQKIIKNEGLSALTKGLTARMMWLSPNIAITMSIYESIKLIFHVEPK